MLSFLIASPNKEPLELIKLIGDEAGSFSHAAPGKVPDI